MINVLVSERDIHMSTYDVDFNFKQNRFAFCHKANVNRVVVCFYEGELFQIVTINSKTLSN